MTEYPLQSETDSKEKTKMHDGIARSWNLWGQVLL